MPDTIYQRSAFALLPELVSYAAHLRDLHPRELMRTRGPNKIAHVKFAVIWVAREVMPELFSYPFLARRLGFKDHTSVIHGYRVADTLRDKDARYRLLTDRLMAFAQSRLTIRPVEVAA